jgi:hypothetical protein
MTETMINEALKNYSEQIQLDVQTTLNGRPVSMSGLVADLKKQITSVIIPRTESNHSAVQIHLSAYQSSLHLSRTCDLRSCLTASLTSEASSDFQQSRGCKTTSVITLDSFCGKVDSLRGLGGSEIANQWT